MKASLYLYKDRWTNKWILKDRGYFFPDVIFESFGAACKYLWGYR